MSKIYDAIIVGAGVAGLTAAARLRDFHTCLLEQSDSVGGRISTYSYDGINIDMGACFAFEPDMAANTVDRASLIKEEGPLGISDSGRIYYGASPVSCMQNMALNEEVKQQIEAWAMGRQDATSLSGPAHKVINALFHQIHAGDISEYSQQIQRQAIQFWYPHHWESGNMALVQALLDASETDATTNAKTNVKTNAKVLSVEQSGEHVSVSYQYAGREELLHAKTAIIATPANVASRIFHSTDTPLKEFLQSVRYSEYIVVTFFAIPASSLPPFRCVVSTDSALYSVIQQRSRDATLSSLLCYFGNCEENGLNALSDTELQNLARVELSKMGFDDKLTKALGAVKISKWNPAGTIISPAFLQLREKITHPSDNKVFLAGDYMAGLGYGIRDASLAGAAAAKQAIRSIQA